MKKPLNILIILTMLAVISPVTTAATSPSEKPSILLITLDTTRADSLGSYGNHSAGTPVLDELSQEGVLFQNTWCSAPLTLPSHVTIMTGLYPPSHGIPVNGAGVLSGKIPVLAELVKTAGYRTGAFLSSAVLDHMFGLDRGFDVYEDSWPGLEAGSDSRPADSVCNSVIRWLAADTHTPFMAWIHLYDPHIPYAPPEQYLKAGFSNYDGEIAFADRQIQRVIAWLSQKNRLKNTLIVIVGDHGESFQEHHEPQHGLYVYDTTMKVPFLLWNPNLLTPGISGKIHDSPVPLTDLMPTVLDIVNLTAPVTMDGQSLLPFLNSGKTWNTPCYGESRYPHLSFGWAPLHTVITEDWKYIEAPRPELYHHIDDPGELHNVVGQHPDTAENLRNIMNQLTADMNAITAEPAVIDDRTRMQLERLGYVPAGEVTDATSEPGKLRDPKDMHTVFTEYITVRNETDPLKPETTISQFEELVRLSPESREFHYELGKACFDAGNYRKALPEFQNAVTGANPDPLKLTYLGDAYRLTGQVDEAIAVYKEIIRQFPRFGQAHSRLGIIYTNRNDFKQAHYHLKQFVDLYPNYANAYSNFGNSMLKFGEFEMAAQALQRAVDLQPDLKSAHSNLWMAYLRMGRRHEAITALENAARYLPDNLIIANRLAWFLAVNSDPTYRDPERALSIARTCLKHEPDNALHLDVMAAALAAIGDFSGAEQYAAEAITKVNGNPAYQLRIKKRLTRYQNSLPYFE